MRMMARRQSEHRFGMNHVRQLFGNASREAFPTHPVSLNRRQAIPRATSVALIAERLSKSAHSRQCPTPDSAFVPINGLQQSPLDSSRPTAAAETGNRRPPQDRALCQEFLHDLPADVGQPEVAPHVPIGESLVIKPHQMQERRLQVMDMHGILDNVEA